MTTMKKSQSGVRLPKQLMQQGKPDARNSGLAIDTTSVPKVPKKLPGKSISSPGYKPSQKKYKTGGSVPKAKSGKSFPDLNKDGKVTKADILKGRGVIAKNGKPVKKAFLGAALPIAMKALPMLGGMLGGKGKGGGGGGLGGMLGGLLGGKNGKTVKKSRSGSSIKKAQDGEYIPGFAERGGPMRKTKVKERSTDGNYVTKTVTRERKGAKNVSSKTRRSFQGFLTGAPTVKEMKSGGKMKKCKGGC